MNAKVVSIFLFTLSSHISPLHNTRHLTLLKRDKEFLIGKCIENFGMGIGMALIFLQAAVKSALNIRHFSWMICCTSSSKSRGYDQ